MKLLSLLTIFSLSLAFSLDPSESKVEWMTPVDHDFGDMLQNNPSTFFFKFKNISGAPFIIDNVRTTCGCTAPDWSYDPVEPDSIGTIRIVYDAARTGYFHKKIKVFFSGQRKAERLSIQGYVE